MWKLYDALIEGIPEHLTADEIIIGNTMTLVRSGDGVGFSGFSNIVSRQTAITRNLLGAPLREVAQAVKSWNFPEASMGLAAINACYNNPAAARAAGVSFSDVRRTEDRMHDPFITSQNQIRGKKVVVVGHFPYVEQLFAPVCDLAVISQEPEKGEYPFSAGEYLLPGCEYAFISSTALVDKTLPRLLELARNAKEITLVSPSTPLAPALFDFGVDHLSGFIIKDNALASRIVSGAEGVRIYTSGQKVNFSKNRP